MREGAVVNVQGWVRSQVLMQRPFALEGSSGTMAVQTILATPVVEARGTVTRRAFKMNNGLRA